MRIRTGLAIVAATLLVLLGGKASACGYCVEDKIASTYDHSVVTRALSQKHHVAFFHIDGRASPGEATWRILEEAVYAVPGVDRSSARISRDTSTVSFSFDPGRVSLIAITARLDRKMAAHKLSFMPLRVMEKPADLKTVTR
jgi:hypothetical protein